MMIRKIAEECKLDKDVVGETVNRMFESGLQYDNHDEVVKMLKPKVKSLCHCISTIAPVLCIKPK